MFSAKSIGDAKLQIAAQPLPTTTFLSADHVNTTQNQHLQVKAAKSAQKIQQTELGSSMRRAKTDLSLKDSQAPSLLPTASTTNIDNNADLTMSEMAELAVKELCAHNDYLVNRKFSPNRVSASVRELILQQVEKFKLKNIQNIGSKSFCFCLFLDLIGYHTHFKYSKLYSR